MVPSHPYDCADHAVLIEFDNLGGHTLHLFLLCGDDAMPI